MEESIEIVLEDVERSAVVSLFMLFISKSEELIVLESSEDIGEKDSETFETLCAAVGVKGDISVFAGVRNLAIGTVLLSSALVRMVKYGDHYDIDLSFVSELDLLDIKEIQSAVLHIAGEFGVSTCYAGLEPAADIETRLFTNEEIGPLLLD